MACSSGLTCLSSRSSCSDGAEDNEDPVEATSEQDEWEDRQVSPDEHATHEDSKDSNYLPVSED